jgi:hypothetical protein
MDMNINKGWDKLIDMNQKNKNKLEATNTDKNENNEIDSNLVSLDTIPFSLDNVNEIIN